MPPLTKHLYREDEVAAALMFCILRGRTQEAVFWCLELLESGLVDRFLECSRTIWLLGFCTVAPRWLVNFEAAVSGDAIEEEVLLDLIGSLSILAAKGMRECPVLRVLTNTLQITELMNNLTISECLYYPKELETAAGAIGERFTALVRACIETKDPTEFLKRWKADLPRLPEDLRATIQGWKAASGLHKSRRLYTIPIDCLYWATERGRVQTVYESNEKEILRSLEKPKGIWGSDYWDEAAEEFGGWEAIRNDDEARETFYDAHFADDIPDEWSKAERVKSHGCGVLQKSGMATAADWIRRWFLPLGLCTPAQIEALKGIWIGEAAPKMPAEIWI